ncbi:phage tail protein [Moraxella catarrhalis]|uniref:tail assembly protein n=1 Tax=Moraxella catarrhalis TaxID=480 RepID=UPI0007203348|nr:tail assembly protein [Moraxella catarrhalis]AKI27401.1 tail protein [Moraxella phage Mcat9]MPX19072.1 phage tail protein [Moraxella catarrhalis]
MKTIQLHGILAKKFGRFFKLDVKSAKEACHALACQIPAFGQFMADSEQLGYRFAVFNGKKQNQKTNIGENQLNDITTANHIHIVPKVIGSGGKALGWIQVVVGVALIATGVGAGIGAGLTLSAAVAANIGMIGAGAGLLLGGVSALMMPTPKLDVANEDGNKPNNGFGGAVTTVAQGNPVPILYGERDVGGFIVSAGISV